MQRKRSFLVLLLMIAISGCQIAENILISFNMDPMTGTFHVTGGNWNSFSDPIDVGTLVDSKYADDIKGFRVFDIRVRLEGAVPAGLVSGVGLYSINGGAFSQLVTFNGQASDFSSVKGVSVLHGPPLIAVDDAALSALVAGLNAAGGTSTVIVLSSTGTSPTGSFDVVIEILGQADVAIN